MKTLKWIGISLLALIILLLIAAYFMPRKMELSVTEKVDAPSIYAYNLLNDFKNQTKWDPWLSIDTTMNFQYGDRTKGEGAYVDYNSKSYGKGRTTRVVAIKGEKISLEAVSLDNGKATMEYTFIKKGDQTDLKWDFDTEIPWPMNITNWFMGRSMKAQMKDGIKNISNITHERWKDLKYDGYIINQVVLVDKNYVTNRGRMPMEKVSEFFSRNMTPLFQKIQAAGVEFDGNQSALIYNHDQKNNTLDIAAALPIKEEVAIAGASFEHLDAGKVVSIDYYGDPAGTASAHNAIESYLNDRGILFNYPVVEEYVTDPSEEEDPNKWLTKVSYYLAQ